jgi:hypothetical protein
LPPTYWLGVSGAPGSPGSGGSGGAADDNQAFDNGYRYARALAITPKYLSTANNDHVNIDSVQVTVYYSTTCE